MTKILDAAQGDLESAKDDPTVLTSGAGFTKSNDLATAYGMTECASSS